MDKEEEEKLQKVYNQFEEEYYVSCFKSEEEVKKKIKELNYDIDAITSWIETVM